MPSKNASLGLFSAGPLLVAAAAALWATDALFRAPTAKAIDPIFIVLFEHAVGTLILGIWAFFRNREQLTALQGKSWFSLLLVGAGGSALATVLFTASFQHINPSIAILLQKLQPVLVVVFAFIFLREIPSKKFWGWALVALAAAIVVSFPNFDFSFLSRGIDWQSEGVIYAGSAAALWALSTVAGKSVVNQAPPIVVTFWRYLFGLSALSVLVWVAGDPLPTQQIQNPEILHSLLYMAFMPGILALVCYYNGLSRTTATTASFIELLFPIAAVVLNWFFLHATLVPVQMLAGLILLYAVAQISALV